MSRTIAVTNTAMNAIQNFLAMAVSRDVEMKVGCVERRFVLKKYAKINMVRFEVIHVPHEWHQSLPYTSWISQGTCRLQSLWYRWLFRSVGESFWGGVVLTPFKLKVVNNSVYSWTTGG